jgi:LPS-assembly protein
LVLLRSFGRIRRLRLREAPALGPLPRGETARQLPIIVRARELRGRPDLETVADGDAEFRRGGLVIRADRLSYEHPDDLAQARGNVRISRDGNVYSGPELQLHVQRFEGWFLEPTYFFGRTGAGGTARRIDFLDEQRAVASGATYSSCPTAPAARPGCWPPTASRWTSRPTRASPRTPCCASTACRSWPRRC